MSLKSRDDLPFWSRASFIPLDFDFRYFGLCDLQTPNFQFQFPSMTANPKKKSNVYCHIFSLKSMYECELPLLVPDRAHAQNEPSAGNTNARPVDLECSLFTRILLQFMDLLSRNFVTVSTFSGFQFQWGA